MVINGENPFTEQPTRFSHPSIYIHNIHTNLYMSYFGFNLRDSLFNVDTASISGLLYEVNCVSHQYVTGERDDEIISMARWAHLLQ